MQVIRPGIAQVPLYCSHHVTDLGENLICSESKENLPLELHLTPRRFDPILDIGMNSYTNRFSCHARTGFASILPMHNTESENTKVFAVDNRTPRSVYKVALFQELCCQSITDMPWISVRSLINFFVTSNNCFTIRCG